MQKEIRKFVAAISALGLLAGCLETDVIEAKKDDTSVSAQNIRPFVDHDGLARRYENRASKLLEIAAEHEKRLAVGLAQKYTLAAEKATESAAHHRTVSQLAKRDYIASRASP
jgi:outer membrane murein-binding lipoprotein Lpp